MTAVGNLPSSRSPVPRVSIAGVIPTLIVVGALPGLLLAHRVALVVPVCGVAAILWGIGVGIGGNSASTGLAGTLLTAGDVAVEVLWGPSIRPRCLVAVSRGGRAGVVVGVNHALRARRARGTLVRGPPVAWVRGRCPR